MKVKFLIALCSALSLCVEVCADGDHEARRGQFPYMAFIYYPDESVVDATGARFLRGAVLIRPEWLVTSAVGPSVITEDTPLGFPRKTLLARLGAISIDGNFTLNEDEDEQEREVIQIVRPYNHSATQWWLTDISLMKVLLPFNLTTSVGIAKINPKRDLGEKTCTILVFAKKDSNDTNEDKTLTKLYVDMLPPSIENCGSHFSETMACANGSELNKNTVYDGNFCQGNSGGPLICENEVVGTQTYIDNDCKQPHLYQLLSAWDNFITCGTENNCQEEKCSQVCDVANKDPPVTSSTEKTTASSEEPTLLLTETVPSTESTVTSAKTELTTDDSEVATTATTINLESEDSTTTTETPTPSETSPTEAQSPTDPDIFIPFAETTTKAWPHERDPDGRKKLDQGEEGSPERKPRVEARHQQQPAKPRSAGPSHVSNILSLFFGFFILACLV
ncbi:hypothetical protein PYW07_016074 [Mythimna separata]|uniref:Peptidase S1 domain-containing protein n=1 Tax=Mythimna separata TaxID=271217 RepID=A0AAD7YSM4_MYTSE|nr:hypothetical protein PYW07_016074 [Mythimna separata]